MEQQIFHGELAPVDIAQVLMAEFNRGNMHAQILGESDHMIVQIATRPGAISGGQTALTVNLQKVADGVMVQLGQQAWYGVAASLGQTAFSFMRNPLNLLGRLDDLAQDFESLVLHDKVWQVISQTARAAGASHQLSERLARLTCDYCGTANPVGEPSCIACGAPMGAIQPKTCDQCGYIVIRGETACPNCGQPV
jgi:hypothetical protein